MGEQGGWTDNDAMPCGLGSFYTTLFLLAASSSFSRRSGSPFRNNTTNKHINAQKNPKTRPHQLRPDSRDVLQPAHDGRHCTSRGAVDALHSRALHAGQALHGNHTLTRAHL
ncbi:hypothetical protein GQ607_006161 [Colletotrichum asianum]|uniref:Uncharacterized protein n=1 Tax=Colletotrichum asianum TaxID=702518 RepID=A0A8H3ZP61_9PEZI|nr:hypothetical protein GQ607_006161 [Colletotrichum asianum]